MLMVINFSNLKHLYLLRPVAQLYGQVCMYWNHRIVIDQGFSNYGPRPVISGSRYKLDISAIKVFVDFTRKLKVGVQ